MTIEYNSFKGLLHQVSSLNAHYQKINSLTGENFNIFRIFKLEASEVRLHSAFLAALLDPNGSHGQQDTFLKLFIKQFCFKQNVIDTTGCKVEVEKHAGFISEDRTEGGRIDIIISDKSGHQIIIENKIYAGDQQHQLQRYYNHSPNADLVYLTLDGRLPHEDSFGELLVDTHFKCYSYKSDILDWLEACRKEVAIYPVVRESITQYINLIKHLTNQTINHTMQEELSQLLLSNLEASFTISNSLDQTLDILLKDDFIPKLQGVCKDLGLKCTSNIDFNRNYTGVWIWKEDWQYVNIGFQFWSSDKEMVYGFVCKNDPNKQPIPTQLRSELITVANRLLRQNTWWPLHGKMDEPFGNWQKYQAWKAIQDGSMLLHIKDKIIYLLEITKHLTL